MSVTLTQSAWFLPFVVPICLWVAWSDLRRMKIPNNAVYALALTFVIVGVPALPLQDYLWRYAHLLIVLIIGIVLNAGGILGAGDAKFAAAASIRHCTGWCPNGTAGPRASGSRWAIRWGSR
mgnify:CR=1 FL=1